MFIINKSILQPFPVDRNRTVVRAKRKMRVSLYSCGRTWLRLPSRPDNEDNGQWSLLMVVQARLPLGAEQKPQLAESVLWLSQGLCPVEQPRRKRQEAELSVKRWWRGRLFRIAISSIVFKQREIATERASPHQRCSNV